MTLAEAIARIAEILEIDIADGTLSEEGQHLLLKAFAEVDREVAEKGFFESKLTDAELAMPVEEFFAMCLRRCNAS